VNGTTPVLPRSRLEARLGARAVAASLPYFALLLLASNAQAEPTVSEILRKYDEVMGPQNMDGVSSMTAHRDDDTERTYKMRFLKSGTETFRLWFKDPAAVRGQEILRRGDNNWVYLPNLKRAMRLASRDSFQGGDFNNADVLRVDYENDYTGTLTADSGGVPDSYVLDLKAKSKDAAYDRIKLWVHKADYLPIKGEYYSASGKMLRAAEFSEVKDFGGIRRPARIVMKNMLDVKRFSIMSFETIDVSVSPSEQRFTLDDLGH
jgi:outer membrane lipoprotein-sorting protein